MSVCTGWSDATKSYFRMRTNPTRLVQGENAPLAGLTLVFRRSHRDLIMASSWGYVCYLRRTSRVKDVSEAKSFPSSGSLGTGGATGSTRSKRSTSCHQWELTGWLAKEEVEGPDKVVHPAGLRGWRRWIMHDSLLHELCSFALRQYT
jgi:hypothetical protein